MSISSWSRPVESSFKSLPKVFWVQSYRVKRSAAICQKLKSEQQMALASVIRYFEFTAERFVLSFPHQNTKVRTF